MSTPSLCGSFLTNKRSLIAFTWTLTTVLTLVAFIVATAMTIHTHIYYSRAVSQRQAEYEASQNQQYENEKQEHGHSADKEWEHYLEVSQMTSNSMTFVAVYTMSMAVALSMYGSTAIVGFTSLRGVYIAPCFSYPGPSRLKVGIFGGAVIFFANLLLVCAVVFGEVRVVDNNDNGNDAEPENREKYEVERIATILAVTCMFLSALYTVFAVLLFLYYGSEDNVYGLDDEADGVVVVSSTKKQPSILGTHTSDPRRENFITMGGA